MRAYLAIGFFARAFLFASILAGSVFLCGCIADTAEDTDLPWASNKNWEGIAPIAPTLMDRYE